jgi:iron complex transport system ATP-binding protein
MVLLKNGQLTAAGPVAKVLTDRHLLDVFGCALRVNRVPTDGAPFVLAHSALTD